MPRSRTSATTPKRWPQGREVRSRRWRRSACGSAPTPRLALARRHRACPPPQMAGTRAADRCPDSRRRFTGGGARRMAMRVADKLDACLWPAPRPRPSTSVPSSCAARTTSWPPGPTERLRRDAPGRDIADRRRPAGERRRGDRPQQPRLFDRLVAVGARAHRPAHLLSLRALTS
jgi:hypothetical protein